MANTKTKIHQGYLYGGILAVALVALLVVANMSTAASTFLIRGDVIKFDKANGTVHVYIRHTNSAAEKYGGEIREINAKTADFYKYDSKQNKVKSTFGSTIDDSGYEIVIRGTVDESDHFKAAWVVRNDHTVKLRGYLRGQSTSGNYLDIEIDKLVYEATGKAYKSTIFKAGDTVRVRYDDDSTKFVSRDGNAMNEDEFLNSDEKITVQNMEVKYGSRFEADAVATITDGKWLF